MEDLGLERLKPSLPAVEVKTQDHLVQQARVVEDMEEEGLVEEGGLVRVLQEVQVDFNSYRLQTIGGTCFLILEFWGLLHYYGAV